MESVKNGKRYVGLTSKDVEVRLKQHNSGSNRWTRHNRPFRLVHWEEFSTRAEASKRERFLKSGAGRKIRDSLIVGD
ncbi:MAG TPA: GIY-YIG nuclease family protein [Dehalococcoidia bacterium]|nr:GIY-YIG nuclease family protein [Dehalococcoidia bacterium]